MKVAVLVLALAAPLAAQEPRFGATIDVTIVEVEAVVTDRDGNPVHGLTADDFEIFEGRERQEITNFSEYRARSGVDSAAKSADAGEAPSVDDPEPRTILLVIDTMPLRGLDRRRLWDALRGFIQRAMRPGDRAGLVRWDVFLNSGRTLLEPTDDREAVLRLVDHFAGRLRAAGAPTSAADDAAFLRGADPDFDADAFLETSARFQAEQHAGRMRRKSAALQRLLSTVGLAPGRKVVLYVSDDFGLPDPRSVTHATVRRMFEAVAETANAHGISLYAIHPHQPDGLPTAADRESPGHPDSAPLFNEVAGLALVAEPTGGLVDMGPAAMEHLGRRLASDLESYYSIGYRARSDGRDRTRAIRVRVKNSEYRVRARKSFVEKSSETFAREALVARLFAEEGDGDFPIEAMRGEARPARRNRRIVPVDVRIPVDRLAFADEGGKQVARIKVFVVSGNGIAEVTKVTEEDVTIVEPPGATREGAVFTYGFELLADEKGSRVSIGVFDERTGLAGYAGLDVRAGAENEDTARSRR